LNTLLGLSAVLLGLSFSFAPPAQAQIEQIEATAEEFADAIGPEHFSFREAGAINLIDVSDSAAKSALSEKSAAAKESKTALPTAKGQSAAKTCEKPHFIGWADYYHHSFYGKRTASGHVLHREKLTAAHRTLPFGTRVKVTNKVNGTSCVVVINDRGPFTPSKVIDLSHAAASQLGMLRAGTVQVACTILEKSE
jgi:rare lipoprotein A